MNWYSTCKSVRSIKQDSYHPSPKLPRSFLRSNRYELEPAGCVGPQGPSGGPGLEVKGRSYNRLQQTLSISLPSDASLMTYRELCGTSELLQSHTRCFLFRRRL